MSISLPEADQLLQEYFSIDSLNALLFSKIKKSKAKGIDRISFAQFHHQSTEQIKIIHKKCLEGTYKFSPYLETLQSKGREKNPRVIAIPTVRDRLALVALKEILFKIYPECTQKKLPKTYIHGIQKIIKNEQSSELGFFRTDITNFYGSINRDKLFDKLRMKINSDKVLELITQAIETPIVPKNYKKHDSIKYKEIKGIPQGLSISNILAAIYVNEIDQDLIESLNNKYFRYVDDILIFGSINKLDDLSNQLSNKIESLELKINQDKTQKGSINQKFDYLGYSFELPKITVKQASVDRFIDSIMAKFSYFKHNKVKLFKKHGDDLEKVKSIFILELNEKITGAISENKCYGWVFYYNAINDLSILYKIDKIIARQFEGLQEFNAEAPKDLKKISKAYHEGIYNKNSGYIHNYNNYITREQKMKFLSSRGAIDPSKAYSEQEINELYESVKARNLSQLEKDNGNIY